MRGRNVSVVLSLLCLLGSALVFRAVRPQSEGSADSAKADSIETRYWMEIPNVEKNRTQIGKENAVIYMLVRNMELHEALESIRMIEDRFNRRYHYPWVFLNDDWFTEDFKRLTSGMVSGEAKYGHIEPEVWDTPPHIDEELYEQRLQQMVADDVIYGGSRSYRNMCRFNSGNFFWHPLMLEYDYYWRVEPSIKLYCDQRYDPFEFMRINDKKYGFVVSLVEYKETIMTLYRTFLEFAKLHPEYIQKDNALAFATDFEPTFPWVDEKFIRDHSIDGYNTCHFWSNFEIGSLNFFRSEAYSAYFNYLDQAGGFYYERWGDAPVHTLGVLALLNSSQIHHFGDIGYYHPPFWRCPHDSESFDSGRCLCPPEDESIDFQKYSCLPKWFKHFGKDLLYEAAPDENFE